MAYQVRRIDPRDLQPRKAIGVNLPFSGPAVFNLTYQTKDAIKANLINFFLTNPGERVFNLDFGAGLRRFIFENITTSRLENIRNVIASRVSDYFPRIIINALEINSTPDSNLIEFYFNYSISETNIINQEINIQIQQ
jgi:phage baseplate assembly protein W